MELQGERTAALSVLRLGEPFTADEQEIVTRLASLVALAWATERYQHQLAEIARLRERERIADELHDRVAQILFAAQLGLDAQLERGVVDQPMLVEVRELLTQGDNAIRAVIHQLSVAPAGTSLVRRLHLEVGSVEDEFGVVVHVDLPAEDDLAGLPRPVVEAAVKVAREGMVNAAKHAGPCRISLSAQVRDGELVVVVADDGMHQMGVPEPRHGLTALARVVADAGGLFAVEPGEVGTRARASFPL